MRVVLDTNVLVSAFVFPGGAPETVYRLAVRGDIESVTSAALLAELGRVLHDKFGWESWRVERAVLQVAHISDVAEPVEAIDVVLDDPADDRVLEAAIAGDASHIVSGDQHLLGLHTFRQVEIVTPRQLLGLVGVE